MADAKDTKAPGKAGLVITLGVLTVLGVVGGGLVGKLIAARMHPADQAATDSSKPKALPYGDTVEVKELPPIVTNLATPTGMRVRLQVSIVYAKAAVENPTILMAQVNDDLIAFMKTLSLPQLEGASGLQNLREDLTDRAVTRSEGKVRELIIETLVMQ